MRTTLRVGLVRAPAGESAVAPLVLDGLPAEIDALGRRWLRKVEFHLTIIGKAVIDRAGSGDPRAWKRERQLAERAPELSDSDQDQLRRAMRFDEVFGGSSNE